MKKFLLGTAGLALIGTAAAYFYVMVYDNRPVYEIEYEERPEVELELNETKNAYFGDLHVHTRNSFDAFIQGTRTSADDAYRFAKGEAIDNGAGVSIKLSGPPLDFYGVTDHGEYMGVIRAMHPFSQDPIRKTKTAKSVMAFTGLTREQRMEAFMHIGTTIVTGEEIEDIYDRELIDSSWAFNVNAAERHYEPGKFTTFAAYEYTQMNIIGEIDDNLGATNLHRNVVFKDKAPERLFTTLDSTNPEDLWEWMNKKRGEGYEVLAIPHNSNGSNGQMFATTMTDGSPITAGYAQNRMLNEPIVEMAQVKGTSETHPLLSTEDEFADHELYEILVGMPVEADKVAGSFVRQALAIGMRLEETTGENPYEFGFIGSSDSHVSAPSLSEEDHFGKFALDADIDQRGSIPPDGGKEWGEARAEGPLGFLSTPEYSASGLAGVWAKANTREHIFEAMQRKETFATSGPRLKVRFFGGDLVSPGVVDTTTMLDYLYDKGVPMGGTITGGQTSPGFVVWGVQDPDGTPLQRVQIIKSWSEGERNMEEIHDVACAEGVPNPQTRRCPDNGAKVDISDCSTNDETGVAELRTFWTDPNYMPGRKVAYYVRVLENPKCRWSTWDAIRNGTPPIPDYKPTLQDRAWSSPIWVVPG